MRRSQSRSLSESGVEKVECEKDLMSESTTEQRRKPWGRTVLLPVAKRGAEEGKHDDAFVGKLPLGLSTSYSPSSVGSWKDSTRLMQRSWPGWGLGRRGRRPCWYVGYPVTLQSAKASRSQV